MKGYIFDCFDDLITLITLTVVKYRKAFTASVAKNQPADAFNKLR